MPPFKDLLVCGISSQLRHEVKGFDELTLPRDTHSTSSGSGRESLVGSGFYAISTATPSPGTVVKNNIGMEFAFVPPGSFKRGSNEPSAANVRPAHQVTFAKGFYMWRHEVTQAQWQKLMGNNRLSFKDCGENRPVGVSWDEAQEFIDKLSAQQALGDY
jgi:formylglycine-generating enzyme required for sulfatase activity